MWDWYNDLMILMFGSESEYLFSKGEYKFCVLNDTNLKYRK